MIKTIYINKVTTREKRIRADGEYECVLIHCGWAFTAGQVQSWWPLVVREWVQLQGSGYLIKIL